MSASGLLQFLGIIAGPIAAMLVLARQTSRDPDPMLRAMLSASRRFEHWQVRPARWYHHLAAGMLVTLPIAQWVAYSHYGTAKAFLGPLILFVTIAGVTAIVSPRAVNPEPIEKKEFVHTIGAAALCAGALFMPPSPTMLIVVALLIDVSAIMFLTLLMRVAHARIYGTR